MYYLFQVKNINNNKNTLLLNNQLGEEKLNLPNPLHTIVNNLHTENITCNKCKELVNNTHVHCTKDKVKNKGFVNLGFVDQLTESSSWYQPYLQREIAVKILSDCPVGSFLVRNSQTHQSAGCLALTVRVPKSFNGSGILHYLIQVQESGFRIKGFTKVFPSLPALVVHHSVMKENLPCRLIIEDEASSESDRESDFADLDSDPEYPDIIHRLREQLTQ